jgi:hypothetical protein
VFTHLDEYYMVSSEIGDLSFVIVAFMFPGRALLRSRVQYFEYLFWWLGGLKGGDH